MRGWWLHELPPGPTAGKPSCVLRPPSLSFDSTNCNALQIERWYHEMRIVWQTIAVILCVVACGCATAPTNRLDTETQRILRKVEPYLATHPECIWEFEHLGITRAQLVPRLPSPVEKSTDPNEPDHIIVTFKITGTEKGDLDNDSYETFILDLDAKGALCCCAHGSDGWNTIKN